MSSAVNLIVAAGQVAGLQEFVQGRKRQTRAEKEENDTSDWRCGLRSAQLGEWLRVSIPYFRYAKENRRAEWS